MLYKESFAIHEWFIHEPPFRMANLALSLHPSPQEKDLWKQCQQKNINVRKFGAE